jgi:hypothetical protein
MESDCVSLVGWAARHGDRWLMAWIMFTEKTMERKIVCSDADDIDANDDEGEFNFDEGNDNGDEINGDSDDDDDDDGGNDDDDDK